MREAGQNNLAHIAQHIVERLRRLRRHGRQAFLDLAGARGRAHWARRDARAVIRDQIDQFMPAPAEFLGGHDGAERGKRYRSPLARRTRESTPSATARARSAPSRSTAWTWSRLAASSARRVRAALKVFQ